MRESSLKFGHIRVLLLHYISNGSSHTITPNDERMSVLDHVKLWLLRLQFVLVAGLFLHTRLTGRFGFYNELLILQNKKGQYFECFFKQENGCNRTYNRSAW